MMQLRRWTKVDTLMQERMRMIVSLGRRRDEILERPVLDLEALERLVEDYEEAEMVCAALTPKADTPSPDSEAGDSEVRGLRSPGLGSSLKECSLALTILDKYNTIYLYYPAYR
jgi:hypothetical protein